MINILNIDLWFKKCFDINHSAWHFHIAHMSLIWRVLMLFFVCAAGVDRELSSGIPLQGGAGPKTCFPGNNYTELKKKINSWNRTWNRFTSDQFHGTRTKGRLPREQYHRIGPKSGFSKPGAGFPGLNFTEPKQKLVNQRTFAWNRTKNRFPRSHRCVKPVKFSWILASVWYTRF